MNELINNPEVWGWVGNSLLALCAIPQAMKAYKNGHSKGISWLFIIGWFIGECLAFGYHISTSDKIPQIFNYLVNIAGTSIILWYRIFERKE